MSTPTTLLLAAIDPIGIIIGAGIGVVVGGIGAWLFIGATTGKSIRTARAEGESIVEKARNEAQTEARRIESETEKKVDQRRKAVDKEAASMLADAKDSQARSAKREETLDQKLDQLTRREEKLERVQRQLRHEHTTHREKQPQRRSGGVASYM